MTKTWDFIFVPKPSSLPHTTVVTIEKSVTSISYAHDDEPEKKGELQFIVAPCYFSSRIITRKLTFSLEKNPKLDYEYADAGSIKLNGKDVYLLIEK
jgi:hypothetical protein